MKSLHPALAGLFAVALLLSSQRLQAQDTLPLWPEDSPELDGVEAAHRPTLRLYHGPKVDGRKPAVLICPAGGYKHHSNMTGVAQWLTHLGIAAYVVSYRLPVHGYKHPAPWHDAQRAMRIIRHNADAWGLDAERIGLYGSSSGGHVATTLATHATEGNPQSTDPIEREHCRPDFVMLNDAVITMQGKACHTPSRGRLLPENPQQQLVDLLSNELQVSAATPPTLLIVGGQDRLVPADNSLLYFLALRKQGVAFSELHFFSHGGHGYETPEWFDLGEGWLRRLAVLPRKDGSPVPAGWKDPGAWASGDLLAK